MMPIAVDLDLHKILPETYSGFSPDLKEKGQADLTKQKVSARD
jgi:hypothetical protein